VKGLFIFLGITHFNIEGVVFEEMPNSKIKKTMAILDTSFLIEYYLCNENKLREYEEEDFRPTDEDIKYETQLLQAMGYSSDTKVDKVSDFKKIYKLLTGKKKSNVTLFITPLIEYEFLSWYTLHNFKSVLTQFIPPKEFQKIGDKDAFGYLLKARNAHQQLDEKFDSFSGTNGEDEKIWADLTSICYVSLPRFTGIKKIQPKNGKLSFNDNKTLIWSSILKIGAADLIHLKEASSLKSDYFITLDSDFQKPKDKVEATFNLKIINTAKDTLQILST
jgi:hypothetical protein